MCQLHASLMHCTRLPKTGLGCRWRRAKHALIQTCRRRPWWMLLGCRQLATKRFLRIASLQSKLNPASCLKLKFFVFESLGLMLSPSWSQRPRQKTLREILRGNTSLNTSHKHFAKHIHTHTHKGRKSKYKKISNSNKKPAAVVGSSRSPKPPSFFFT